MKKLFFLIAMAFSLISFAADTSKLPEPFFNRVDYKKASDGFKYKEPLPLIKTETKNNRRINWEWLKYPSYAIVIIAFVFLIYKLIHYFYSPDNRKLKNSVIDFQKIEEEPSIESNLEALLDLALNENNFREAIRISYLISIRNLNENHIITYTINKTNFEYVSEVGGHPAFPLFRDLTITFERIWFGDVFANESTFNSYRAKYIALNDIIDSDRKTQASE
ncbi:MAG TPA: hypothetical protein PLI47_03005 [Bacteroidia bacterium]|nr:hypothetical protein [Bacteroidia bacterium]